MNGIAAEARKRASATENNALDRCVVAQHRDEGVAAAGIGYTIGDARTLCRQGFRLAALAIVDDDAMAGLDQIERHRRPHVAEANEANIHVRSSCQPA